MITKSQFCHGSSVPDVGDLVEVLYFPGISPWGGGGGGKALLYEKFRYVCCLAQGHQNQEF